MAFTKTVLRPPNSHIGYNSVSIGDKSMILVAKRVFGVRQFSGLFIFVIVPERLMLQKIEQKIGYNLVCVGDMFLIFVPYWSFLESAN